MIFDNEDLEISTCSNLFGFEFLIRFGNDLYICSEKLMLAGYMFSVQGYTYRG